MNFPLGFISGGHKRLVGPLTEDLRQHFIGEFPACLIATAPGTHKQETIIVFHVIVPADPLPNGRMAALLARFYTEHSDYSKSHLRMNYCFEPIRPK